MTHEQAMERAESLAKDIEGGRGYHGRLWEAIATELLRVRNEALEEAAKVADDREFKCNYQQSAAASRLIASAIRQLKQADTPEEARKHASK